MRSSPPEPPAATQEDTAMPAAQPTIDELAEALVAARPAFRDDNGDGQRVLFRIIDPCVPGLMDLGVCLLAQRP